MNFNTKYIKRTGFMGIKRSVAEVRFHVPGAHVLIKVDSPDSMDWSMNGAGFISTGDLVDILTYLRSVHAELDVLNSGV